MLIINGFKAFLKYHPVGGWQYFNAALLAWRVFAALSNGDISKWDVKWSSAISFNAVISKWDVPDVFGGDIV